jgi:DNA-binding response OmpR family regulator
MNTPWAIRSGSRVTVPLEWRVRLLIVEDDDIVADAITRGLTAANYAVHRVASAEAAQAALVNEEFAMAVIDVGLPGADGLTLVRRLRSAGKAMPTLILTARCTLTDKVKALDLGADDFLSKPFEAAELAARCRALMRRSSGASSGIIKLNRMNVDLIGKQLRIDEAEVELTAREWLVLECLVRRVGLIVSKERLQQAVATPDHDSTPNAVEVHVSRLRAKLGTAAVVRSLRGLGYRLEDAKPA